MSNPCCLTKGWKRALHFNLIRSFVCNRKRPSVKQSIKQQACSNFQMKYPDKLSDIPPCKTASNRRWSLHWSMSSMRAHLKQMAELGQVFRWIAQLGQLVRWGTQISSQIYPPVSDEVHTETQIFRWSVQIQIYPPFSDEVLRWSAHWDPNPK